MSDDTLSPQERADLIREIKAAHTLAIHESQKGCLRYLQHVVIDRSPEPTAFRLAAEPWQWALASKIAPAIERIAGYNPSYSGPRCFWFTLPRGHDKTSFIGRFASWALCFNRKSISGIAAARDRDQANFILDYMRAEARLNPWIDQRLSFHNYQVRGQNESKLQIVSADAQSAFGNKSDFVIFDELTHWEKRDLFDSLFSGKEKRPQSVYIVITNAGLLRSWQHELIEHAKKNPDWFVYESPGPIAGWLSQEKIAQDAALLPKGLADRVLYNRWLDPSEGCGYITRAEAEACQRLGRELNLHYRHKAIPGASGQYVAAIDYAPVRDRTVATVGHKDPSGVVVVDKMDVFQGSRENRVQIETLEEWMRDVNEAFRRPLFVVDPYQMESTIQRYSSRFRIERFEARGGKANYELAVNLHNLTIHHQLAWYDGCGTIFADGKPHTLVDEIAELVIKTMTYGYRFDHEQSKHDDRAVALGMMALYAVKEARVEIPDNLDPYF
jgi:hypothetical protein